MLIEILYRLNIYWLILVNISKDTFFNHEKSEPISTNIFNRIKILVNID